MRALTEQEGCVDARPMSQLLAVRAHGKNGGKGAGYKLPTAAPSTVENFLRS